MRNDRLHVVLVPHRENYISKLVFWLYLHASSWFPSTVQWRLEDGIISFLGPIQDYNSLNALDMLLLELLVSSLLKQQGLTRPRYAVVHAQVAIILTVYVAVSFRPWYNVIKFKISQMRLFWFTLKFATVKTIFHKKFHLFHCLSPVTRCNQYWIYT